MTMAIHEKQACFLLEGLVHLHSESAVGSRMLQAEMNRTLASFIAQGGPMTYHEP